MKRAGIECARAGGRTLRGIAIWFTALMLLPVLLLAVAPMLLLLIPVGVVVIPFTALALFGGARTVRLEEHKRASWRPAVAPARALVGDA